MAKSKKELLSGAFSTKKSIPDADKIEEITSKVYKKEIQPEQKVEKVEEEEMQKTTLDLPKSLHLQMKMHAMGKGLTIRKYIIGLIKKDIKV